MGVVKYNVNVFGIGGLCKMIVIILLLQEDGKFYVFYVVVDGGLVLMDDYKSGYY